MAFRVVEEGIKALLRTGRHGDSVPLSRLCPLLLALKFWSGENIGVAEGLQRKKSSLLEVVF